MTLLRLALLLTVSAHLNLLAFAQPVPASGLSDQGVDALAFEAAFRLEAERLTGTDTLAVDAVGLWEAGSFG
ncbi:MAG: hypothetical protein AAF752_06720, partial [Bacteroidota bacterium]